MAKVTRAKSPTGRLSLEQYDLLQYLLRQGATFDLIVWSPSAYLRSKGQEASNARLVGLSKRMSALAGRGLIQREDQKAKLTLLGRRTLLTFARENDTDLSAILQQAETFYSCAHDLRHLQEAGAVILSLYVDIQKGELLEGFFPEDAETSLKNLEAAQKVIQTKKDHAILIYGRLLEAYTRRGD